MRRRRALGRAGEQQAAKGSLRGPVEPPASCSTSMAHVARIDLSISLNGLGIIRYYVPMISSVAGRCRKRSEQRSSGEIGKIYTEWTQHACPLSLAWRGLPVGRRYTSLSTCDSKHVSACVLCFSVACNLAGVSDRRLRALAPLVPGAQRLVPMHWQKSRSLARVGTRMEATPQSLHWHPSPPASVFDERALDRGTAVSAILATAPRLSPH